MRPPVLEISGTITEEMPGPTPSSQKMVYQRTAPGLGNVPGDPTRTRQRRRHVIPLDPQTVLQVERRDRFADAMQAWSALDAEGRAPFITDAKKRGILPHNAFVSHFLRD